MTIRKPPPCKETRMFTRRRSITDCATPLPLESLIQRTRILVIDDVDTEFPFTVLKSQGYSIDYWEDVRDLPRLEAGFYDIIVLDIGGIGQDLDPDEEGVAVLKHLKQVNPAQIIVAYSGQSHESRRIPFFKLADQYVPKPTSAIVWKEILDDLIQNKITVPFLWDQLRRALQASGVSPKQIRRFEATLVKATKNRESDPQELTRKALGTLEHAATIASTVGRILALCPS